MARADLITDLVPTECQVDRRALFAKRWEALIVEERKRRKHNVLAERLGELLTIMPTPNPEN